MTALEIFGRYFNTVRLALKVTAAGGVKQSRRYAAANHSAGEPKPAVSGPVKAICVARGPLVRCGNRLYAFDSEIDRAMRLMRITELVADLRRVVDYFVH